MDSGNDDDAIHKAEEQADAIHPVATEDVRSVNDGNWTQEEIEVAGRKVFPRYERAIDSETVSMAHLSGAHSVAHNPRSDRIDACAAFRYLPELQRCFEGRHGGITDIRYLEDFDAGASCALTGNNVLHAAVAAGTPSEIRQLVLQVEELNGDAIRHLKGEDAGECHRVLFYVVAHLARGTAGLDPARSELSRAEELFKRSVTRQSMLTYFQGMLGGALVLALTIAVVGLLLRFFPVTDLTTTHLMGALVGGALGGFVSVLTRMTSGSLRLVPVRKRCFSNSVKEGVRWGKDDRAAKWARIRARAPEQGSFMLI